MRCTQPPDQPTATTPAPHPVLAFSASLVLLVMLAFSVGCAGDPGQPMSDKPQKPNWTYRPGPVTKLPVMDLHKTIRPGDRILFIGDDITQQMFYTRDVTTALVSLMPQANLRTFNGGKSGATAGSALSWTPQLLELTWPTVVFVALGLNDAFAQTPAAFDTPPANTATKNTAKKAGVASDYAITFHENLSELVALIRQQKSVREIILVGPPAVQSGLTALLPPDSYNARLISLGHEAKTVAQQKNVGYIDLFIHTSAVYLNQLQVGGSPLTLDGKLPSNEGHVIIASVLLRGIGVTGPQLNKINFSPLIPSKMGRIRPALAMKTDIPAPDGAVQSRAIYLSLERYDEAFFKQWRLAGRNRFSLSPQEAASRVELAWGNVQQQIQAMASLIKKHQLEADSPTR